MPMDVIRAVQEVAGADRGMNRLFLRFDDPETEGAYTAAQFRSAYALHLSYTLSLICMFTR